MPGVSGVYSLSQKKKNKLTVVVYFFLKQGAMGRFAGCVNNGAPCDYFKGNEVEFSSERLPCFLYTITLQSAIPGALCIKIP